MKSDPTVPGEPAEEEHWQKVGLKPTCLHLQLGQLGGFTPLLLSSHKSDGNARGSSIRDCYNILHSSKYGKRISHLSRSTDMSDQVALPLQKLPAENFTISLSQIPLGAYGDQFHTQWVLYPIQPKSYFPTHFEP